MEAKIFSDILVKNIDTLIQEISQYPDEQSLWVVEGNISNSAGNLALHLTGNLNFFIGTRIAENGYVRERDKEFSSKDVPKEDILAGLAAIKKVIEETVPALDAEKLNSPFGPSPFGENATVEAVLLNLVAHFTYHLGQVNYHRRLTVR